HHQPQECQGTWLGHSRVAPAARRRGHRMRRREFIAGLAGAAAWPVRARGQQGERARRIGVLIGASVDAEDPDAKANIAAFLQVMQQLGWTDGRNMRMHYRWGAGNFTNIRKHAAELVALAPDVIFATGTVAMAPLLEA